MSDLAVVDQSVAPAAADTRRVLLLGSFDRADAGTQAGLANVVAGLDGIEAVVVDARDRRSVAQNASDSGAIVVLNPVLSSGSRDLWSLASIVARAKLKGKIVALVGVSAWNLNTAVSRSLVRGIVRASDLVLVRDEASADALAAAGVEPPFRLGADPAWAGLDQLYAARPSEDRVIVALDSIIDLREMESLEDTLSEALTPVAASGLDILLHPWESESANSANLLVARNVAERVGPGATVLETPQTLHDMREEYAQSRVVLALQLNAVMAAACAGSRTVSLTSDPAVERLTQSLGMPLVSESVSPQVLAESILAASGGQPASADAVRNHIDRAKGSISLLRTLLTEEIDHSDRSADLVPLYPNAWRA